MPRRATPRTRVPAGSVGLAGPFAGVYPQASPGRLAAGRPHRRRPVRRRPRPAGAARPGTRVRFRDGRLSAHRRWRPGRWPPCRTAAGPARRRIGVPRSGAADAPRADLANRLVGNVERGGGHRGHRGRAAACAPSGPLLVAVTGAPAPVAVDGRPRRGAPLALARGRGRWPRAPAARAAHLPGRPRRDRRPAGARVAQHRHAVRLGPAAAGAGDRLPVGGLRGGEPFVDVAPVRPASGARAARAARPARRLAGARRVGGAAARLGGHRRQRPGRPAAGRPAAGQGPGRRAAQRGAGARRRPGAARRRARCCSSPTIR